jgi:signal transduction histidine kinase
MQHRDLETLAREVRQPVDALGLLTHALRHRLTAGQQRAADGETEVILDQIELGLSQLRRQLASLVDVVRTERSLARSEQVGVPLMPLFEKLGLQTSRAAHDNRVSLTIVPTSLCVLGDPTALEVVLRNLLINGLFFARGGRVLLGCRRRGDQVQIQVWDNGMGISPEHQAVIFEPLTKLKGDGDDMVAGLGLGLSLVRDLARANGYGLHLRSEPSMGSVFSVTLPLAETVREPKTASAGPADL